MAAEANYQLVLFFLRDLLSFFLELDEAVAVVVSFRLTFFLSSLSG